MTVWHEVSEECVISVYDSGAWKDWTDKEKVMLQLFTDRTCMPTKVFWMALTNELNHSVYPPLLVSCLDMVREEWMEKYGLSLCQVLAECVVMCKEASDDPNS